MSPPRGGGTFRKMFLKLDLLFQSTLPARGGMPTCRTAGTEPTISIHPPRGGRDCCGLLCCCTATHFNPPSPQGEGLSVVESLPARLIVSIHPPREGRDRLRLGSIRCQRIFQSTLPVRGGTASKNPQKPAEPTFQSTLPARGGTGGFLLSIVVFEISIHPPRKGRDLGYAAALPHLPDFNPPSPQGEGRRTK